MKKYTLLVFVIVFVLFLASCTLNKNLPATVTLEDKEYRKAFCGVLYPTDVSFPDADDAPGIKLSGTYYYAYSLTDFDCHIAYDKNAEPNVYFSSEQYDEAVSYCTEANNFNYYCLRGNLHDERDQQIYEIQEIDPLMFDCLLKFSEENNYNPFTSFNNEEGLIEVSILSDPDDWMADEIRFYKVSKDGAWVTQKGYTFIVQEEKLYLLYQYNFKNDDAPVMLLREIPTEISDYFCALLKEL